MITFPPDDDIRAALISAGDIEVLIKAILDKIPPSAGSPSPMVVLLQEDGKAFSHVIPSNVDPEFVGVLKNANIEAETTCSARAVHQNVSVYVPDLNEDPHDWEDMPGLWWGLLASWTAPLRTSNGSVLGALTLYFGSPRHPTASDKEALEEFAGRLGSAIQSYLQ